MKELTAERLREVLHYDPETGIFTWRILRQGGTKPGKIAGCIENTGYIRIRIDRKIYSAHRLAFLYMTGRWPVPHVDHINHVRTDNRWANIREATMAQNSGNVRRLSTNTTGFKGVSRSGRGFRATINSPNGYSVHLGVFKTQEEAHDAYCQAARKRFGEFANAG